MWFLLPFFCLLCFWGLLISSFYIQCSCSLLRDIEVYIFFFFHGRFKKLKYWILKRSLSSTAQKCRNLWVVSFSYSFASNFFIIFNLVKILYYTGVHSWLRSGLHCIGKACCFLFVGWLVMLECWCRVNTEVH